MKLASFLLVLATLTLCLASKVDKHSPVYVVLADSEIKHSKLISSLLSFGCDRVLADACSSDHLFVATDFKISKVLEVSRWADKSRALYKFIVRHNHVQRVDLYVESRFTVEYSLSGDVSVTIDKRSSIVFSDYDFHYDETPALFGAYKVIPSREYHNSLLQQLLEHGNGYICGQAKHRNQLLRLPKAIVDLDVIAINKISFRRLDDITYYRYDVCLGDFDHKNYRVDATFIVMLCRKSGNYAIVSVEYHVKDLISNFDCDQDYYRSDSECDYSSSSSSDSECSDKSHKSDSCKDDSSSSSDCTDKNSKWYKSHKSDCSDSASSDDCTDKTIYSHSKKRGPYFDHSDKYHTNKFSNKKDTNRNGIANSKPVILAPPKKQ